ncbi:MAG: DNA polymerase IV [Acidimicrobiales bacterium]
MSRLPESLGTTHRPRPVGAAPDERVILHVDMDSFFASVEVYDDPSLAGRPVIVGGSGSRGVVAACTYEARMFGVHSAMPSSVARRRCPDAVFLDGRFHRYAEESRRLHAILSSFTPRVEGISLDEAFLDVTGTAHLFGDGTAMGREIRARVDDEMGLPCSVGVGRSKLMAKLASKAAKPRASRLGIEPGPGVVHVAAADELAFLHPMPVRALWGIGPVTEKRLLALGVTTVGELAAVPPDALVRYLGIAAGRHLSELARGVDDRPVVPVQEAKSIGHEETFSSDLWEMEDLQRRLHRMVDASATALRRADRAARTVTVKLRFGDFSQITRSHTLDRPVDATPAIAAVAAALLDGVDLAKGVRLLGVSLSGLGELDGGTQLRLELDPGGPLGGPPDGPAITQGCSASEATPGTSTTPGGNPADGLEEAGQVAERLQDTWGSVTGAIDAIRARYGGEAVGPASLVTPEGLRIRRRGEAQWGPSLPVEPAPGADRDEGL